MLFSPELLFSLQEERTEGLTQLKDIEKKHKELKVRLHKLSVFIGVFTCLASCLQFLLPTQNEMVQFADNDPATLEAMS